MMKKYPNQLRIAPRLIAATFCFVILFFSSLGVVTNTHAIAVTTPLPPVPPCRPTTLFPCTPTVIASVIATATPTPQLTHLRPLTTRRLHPRPPLIYHQLIYHHTSHQPTRLHLPPRPLTHRYLPTRLLTHLRLHHQWYPSLPIAAPLPQRYQAISRLLYLSSSVSV